MRLSDLSIAKKIGASHAIVANGAVIPTWAQARGALARQENARRGFILTTDAYDAERVQNHHKSFLGHVEPIRASAAADAPTIAASESRSPRAYKPAPRSVPPRPVPPMRSAGTGGAAPALNTNAATDGWEEF